MTFLCRPISEGGTAPTEGPMVCATCVLSLPASFFPVDSSRKLKLRGPKCHACKCEVVAKVSRYHRSTGHALDLKVLQSLEHNPISLLTMENKCLFLSAFLQLSDRLHRGGLSAPDVPVFLPSSCPGLVNYHLNAGFIMSNSHARNMSTSAVLRNT